MMRRSRFFRSRPDSVKLRAECFNPCINLSRVPEPRLLENPRERFRSGLCGLPLLRQTLELCLQGRHLVLVVPEHKAHGVNALRASGVVSVAIQAEEITVDVVLVEVAEAEEVAKALGVSKKHLLDLVNERTPLTPEVAVRLEAAFGRSAPAWLRLQEAYDLWHARRSVDVSTIPRFTAAA